MSAKPSLLKSPATGCAPPACAHDGKFATDDVVTLNVPLPFENAIGMVPQPSPPTSAMSVRPSLLKSPDTGLAPLVCAHDGKFGTAWLDTSPNLPFPVANAIGIVPQPGPPTRATSLKPSPLKSPSTGCTPGCAAQPSNSLATAFSEKSRRFGEPAAPVTRPVVVSSRIQVAIVAGGACGDACR